MTEPSQPEVQAETVEEAREQVERTREQLGETVSALADKADVKAQVHRKVDETKARVSEKAASLQASLSDGSSPGMSDPVATIKQLGDKLTVATRANPMAALGVAIVVGWVFGRKSKRKRP